MDEQKNIVTGFENLQIKQQKGIFLTTNAEKITKGMRIPRDVLVIEPCVGNGDLLRLVNGNPIETYDIRDMSNKKHPNFTRRDILLSPPSYEGKYLLANPPYLARNKSKDKAVFGLYGENDLYKCFIRTVISDPPIGGIMIVPLNMWCSIRKKDANLRKDFLEKFNIIKFNMFKTQVFDDTSYTVCSFQFEKTQAPTGTFTILSDDEQCLEVVLSAKNSWTIGGELFKLPNLGFIRATTKNKKNLNSRINAYCIDNNQPIRLEYADIGNKLYIDETKNLSSRSFATIITPNALTPIQQKKLCQEFNTYLNEQRCLYHSLFLPNYRDKNRKRIPFDLIYKLMSHVSNKI